MIKLFSKAYIGQYGEKVACRFLRRKGYKIVAKNHREAHKEIDIIAKNKDYITFVEVKTRSVDDDFYNAYGTPASAVNSAKRSNLITGARAYLRSNPSNKQPRMDVIEVYLKKGSKKVLRVNHFEGAYHA